MTANWECGICGREQQELPLEIAFAKPQHFFDTPEDEVGRRVFITPDVCVLDSWVETTRKAAR